MPEPTAQQPLAIDLTEAGLIDLRTQHLTIQSHASEMLKASQSALKTIERLLATKQATR